MNPNDVSNKEELVEFLNTLRNDLTNNITGCENPNLESFLEAMEAWLTDCEYNSNSPTWSLFATSLLAGKAYK
ncbi:hypothetical protein FHT67_006022 [Paenibacillus sp. BK720]|nr:hypothetical protein [Paenibacillus sp. BK720]